MGKIKDIIIADCSGNVTIMVLTPTNRIDYVDVAGKLLEDGRFNAAQVAFIRSEQNDDTSVNDISEMEMCGLEFCGNASRAFAYYKSLRSLPAAKSVDIRVSGCEKVLTAYIDHDTSEVGMNMPVPSSSRIFTDDELPVNTGGILIDIGDISHLILENVAPSYETFENLKDYVYEHVSHDIPAFGVMFCDTVNDLMTPVVYVRDVDTTYFEGSCASGTVAASYAFSGKLPDGEHEFALEQPEGTLVSRIIKKDGRIESIFLSGPVSLSEKISVEL